MTIDVDVVCANDVLIMAVKSLGGSKKVGLMLWADLPMEVAQRKLLDCLDPERPANLKPTQALHLLRLCRDAGDPLPMGHWCRLAGFDAPAMTTRVDEAAELRRDMAAMARQLAGLMARLEAA